MKRLLITLFVISSITASAQLKTDTYYGNKAGWGSTTEIGISHYQQNGAYTSGRIAYIQSTGLGEDSTSIGACVTSIGACISFGKRWTFKDNWYYGTCLDVRFVGNALDKVVMANPCVQIGYSWELLDYELVFGFPYVFGTRVQFNL